MMTRNERDAAIAAELSAAEALMFHFNQLGMVLMEVSRAEKQQGGRMSPDEIQRVREFLPLGEGLQERFSNYVEALKADDESARALLGDIAYLTRQSARNDWRETNARKAAAFGLALQPVASSHTILVGEQYAILAKPLNMAITISNRQAKMMTVSPDLMGVALFNERTARDVVSQLEAQGYGGASATFHVMHRNDLLRTMRDECRSLMSISTRPLGDVLNDQYGYAERVRALFDAGMTRIADIYQASELAPRDLAGGETLGAWISRCAQADASTGPDACFPALLALDGQPFPWDCWPKPLDIENPEFMESLSASALESKDDFLVIDYSTADSASPSPGP